MASLTSTNREKMPDIAFVVPCYNEQEALNFTIPALLSLLEALKSDHQCGKESFIVLIDDGSEDDTWARISTATKQWPRRVRGIRLASNYGHQRALLCGMQYAETRCDAAITMDADLQHDLSAIPKLIQKFVEGFEIVLAVRVNRERDQILKRVSAEGFYWLLKHLGVSVVRNHADFRLMSAKSLANLSKFQESNLFLRAFPPLLHRKIATIEFEVRDRAAGVSKYTLSKMLGLAWDGITSFSTVPLRLVSISGILIFGASIAMVVYAVASALAGATVAGWASIVIPLYFLGGLIMLSIGIVGEYVAKVLIEAKKRPRFLIDEFLED